MPTLIADVDFQPVVAALTIVVSLLTTCLPPVVAANRNHPNLAAICLLTLFLGWSMNGWTIALVWAFSNVSAFTETKQTAAAAGKDAPVPDVEKP